jgi:hypothetical protein
MSDPRVLEEFLARVEWLALSALELGDDTAGGGARDLDPERQALLVGHARHGQADGIRDRQPHRAQCRRGALLGKNGLRKWTLTPIPGTLPHEIGLSLRSAQVLLLKSVLFDHNASPYRIQNALLQYKP